MGMVDSFKTEYTLQKANVIYKSRYGHIDQLQK